VPIYDYVCATCGHRVEVLHGVHERGPALCTVCGGQMKKVFSPPAIHFKGSGWAKKERASSATHRRPKEAAAESSGDGGSGGSSGSKASDSASGAGGTSSGTSTTSSASNAPASD
jgi:putative FmdB family regulatory protein